MNLIINKETKTFHVSTLDTLGKHEILISNYSLTEDMLKNSQNYKVNDTNNGLVLNQEKINLQYQEFRRKEYDELNQFELQYNDSVNGTNTWGESIQAIKYKYPKPE